MEKLVIIPTFNEKENVENIIDAVFALHQNYHVLIIDDGSPDGTANIVKSLFNKYPGLLFLEERKGKLGLGTAYIHGFIWALNRGYQFIFEMDADFSHQPKYIGDFLMAAKEADLVLGTRYIRGGGTEGWGPLRQLISRGGNLYARAVLWLPFKDLTGGFKCFRREVLEG